MIKLIASDLDGTLLDDAGAMPPETFALIRRLRAAGIGFVATSGRRLDTLQRMFAPVANRMDFVASDGAQVLVGGALMDVEVYSPAALRRLARAVDLFDNLHLAVFDRVDSYLLGEEEDFERELDKDLPHPVRARELPPAEVNIVKASVFCDDAAAVMDMAYALSRELDQDFVFAPSGRNWIDVMQRGVSKATGLSQVMQERGVGPGQVMAFGDAMNDYEILRMAGMSVAVGNARPAIKQVACRTIATNAEHGVQRELRAVLEEALAAHAG